MRDPNALSDDEAETIAETVRNLRWLHQSFATKWHAGRSECLTVKACEAVLREAFDNLTSLQQQRRFLGK